MTTRAPAFATPSPGTSYVPTVDERNSDFTNFQDALLEYTGTKTDALGRMFPLCIFFDPATTRQLAAGATDPVSGLPNTSGSGVTVRDPFYAGGSLAGMTSFTLSQQYLNQLPANRLDPKAIKLLSLYPKPGARPTPPAELLPVHRLDQ